MMGAIRSDRFFASLVIALLAAQLAVGAERPDDAVVTDWVEEALAADVRVAGDAIDVATHNGIVTLSGEARTLAGQRYAVLAAQKIVGVLGVIDQLAIDAMPRSDTDIADGVRSRIEYSLFIDSTDLEVVSKNGSVRISGSVGSSPQRYEAELLASEVAGVREVENFLSADNASPRSDEQIKKDVIATLRRDVYLARLPIHASVQDGTVSLTGTVRSIFEASRATSRIRWVDGVREVANQIQVEWPGDRDAPPAVATPRSDEELAATLLEQLAQDVRVDASEIEVTATAGRVLLRGSVGSLREKRIAEEDAWNLAGVGWVSNDLRVTVHARSDAEISNEITAAISTDSELSGVKINVRAEAGLVILEGEVANRFLRVHAGAIASRTRGVAQVENRLIAATWYQRADSELSVAVERNLSLNWQTSDLGDRVQIHVEGGVVTLTGSVERWAERRTAASVAASTQGVRRVRNRIEVRPYPYPWDVRELEVDPDAAPEWDPYYFDHLMLPWVASWSPAPAGIQA